MANKSIDLYKAAMASGKASSSYSSSLSKLSSTGDIVSFEGRKGQMSLSDSSKMFDAIYSGIETMSTLQGAYKDKQKFQSKLDVLGKSLGEGMELQSDNRTFFDKLIGKERTYTFGEGEGSKTFSRIGIETSGGELLGEKMLSMYDEASIVNENINPNSDVKKIPKITNTSEGNQLSSSIKTKDDIDPELDLDKLFEEANKGIVNYGE